MVQVHENADKVIIYFHGNAEDVGHGYFINEILKKAANAHVISIEYPGYGVYEHGEKVPDQDSMFRNADKVYDFLINEKGVPAN